MCTVSSIFAIFLTIANCTSFQGRCNNGPLTCCSWQVLLVVNKIESTKFRNQNVLNSFSVFFFIFLTWCRKGIIPTHVEGHLSFENVQFRYPARPDAALFDDLTFEVPSGRYVCIDADHIPQIPHNYAMITSIDGVHAAIARGLVAYVTLFDLLVLGRVCMVDGIEAVGFVLPCFRFYEGQLVGCPEFTLPHQFHLHSEWGTPMFVLSETAGSFMRSNTLIVVRLPFLGAHVLKVLHVSTYQSRKFNTL